MRTIRVGLTGGIGSGKSAVAEIWRERGAVIIDADAIAREVVVPGAPALREIAARWPTVLRADGTLDRGGLASIVFRDDEARERLNSIVHPRVRSAAEASERDAPHGSIVVHVIPLLFEGEYWRTCDATVLVVAPHEVRIERVVARDGAERDDVERRIAAQIDPAIARMRATYTIENDGDLRDLRKRALLVYERLTTFATGET